MSKWNRLGAAALAAALLFAPFSASVSSAAAPRAPQQDDTPSEAEQATFNKGRDLFAKGQYEQAAVVFRDFLKSNPNSYVADLMLLWLGRSYIELGQLQEAEQVALRLRQIKDTPFSEVYTNELENARRELASRPAPVRPQPTPTPARTVAARATPTPTPARPQPTPRQMPREVARNTPAAAETPTLNINNGEAGRPRTTGRRNPRASRRTGLTNQPTITPTPVPTPTPRRPAETASTSRPPVAAPLPTPTPVPTPLPRPVETARVTPRETAPPVQPVPDSGPPQGGISITVKQVPDLQLALRRAALAAQPGQTIQLPLVITNSGNKEDQFRVETDLPAEYQPTFSQSGNDTGMPIFVTPSMPRGASAELMLNLRVPDSAADSQQQRFIVRAASQADATILKTTDASLTVVAAALTAASNALQESVMPGETFTQRIAVRNQGSATARETRADFVFSPDFELVTATPAPIQYDRASRTASWRIGDLESRDSREITVTLRAVPEALAVNNRPVGRGTMRTASLVIGSNFDGPAINVGRVPRAQVDSVSKGLTATPGDTMFIPFIVRNPSNYPESFGLNVVAPGAPAATVYADLNGDGRHQESEPAVTQTAQLEPRGGQFPVLLRVDIPRTTPDRQTFAYNLVTRAMNASARIAGEDSTVLTVAAPRVRVRPELPNTEVRPGDTFFYRLVLVNDGGGLARNLSVSEYLPDALEFVSSSPDLSLQDMPGGGRGIVWRVTELAPGDTTVLQVTVRLRQNLAAGVEVVPRHSLVYQDSNGNPHRGQ